MAYPYDAATLAALARLDTHYNGNDYNASTNPGGMAAGGHRQNFEPALGDIALVGASVEDAADSAAASAASASTHATNAAASAAKLTGTSTSSVSIGTGSKSFTTQTAKAFDAGNYVNLRSAANPTVNFMIGQVTAYDSGTGALTVNVTNTGGSGSFADWAIAIAGAPGQTGATGATGERGPSPAIQWNFSNGTNDSDPGNGLFKFNSATTSAITEIYLDNLNKDSVDVTAWLDALDDSTNSSDRGRLYFVQPSDPTKFATFKVTGSVTDGTGYRKVAVTYISSSAAGAVPFTNASAVAVDFSPTGNAGLNGAGAGDVVGPSSATDGRIVLFDTGTGKLIKQATKGIGTSGANVGALDTANTYSAQQTYAAKIEAQQDFALSGDISPTQISSNQTDYSPTGAATASVMRINSDAAGRKIFSLAGGADGRFLALLNNGIHAIEVTHDDGATGTASMRFSLPNSRSIFLPPGGGASFIYDTTSSRWRLLFGNLSAVLYDGAQDLTTAQKTQARSNIYAAPLDALGFMNLAVNPCHQVAQEFINISASGNSRYPTDNWLVGYSGAMVIGQQRIQSLSLSGFENALRLTVSTQDTSIAAGDYALLIHRIEGYRAEKLGFGTSGAQSITVGFWVRSSATGTFSVSVQNGATNRSYVTEVTVNAANTWEFKTVTIPGDTSGTWEKTTSTGLQITLALAGGSTFQTAANAWAAGGFYATSNQANFCNTAGTTFDVTGLIVVPGAVVPSSGVSALFMRPLDIELTLCRRQLFVVRAIDNNATSFVVGQAASGAVAYVPVIFPVPMRATPTLTVIGTWGMINAACNAVFNANSITTAAGNNYYAQLSVGLATSGLVSGDASMFVSNGNTDQYLKFGAQL